MEFKVGDRAKIVARTHGHRFELGEVVELVRCCVFGDHTHYAKSISTNNGTWGVHDTEISLLTLSTKIVITTDGSKTLARLYEGNKVVKHAEAKCSPDDEFKFNVGANIAYNRLMFGTDYHPSEVALTKKEDKPKYKVGDTVKMVRETPLNKNRTQYIGLSGKIRRVHNLEDYSHGQAYSTDFTGEFVVYEDEIELFTEPTTQTSDWDAFKAGKIAVRFGENAKEFLKECQARYPKLIWRDGERPSEWMPIEGDDLIFVDEGRLVGVGADCDWHKEHGCTIIDYPFTENKQEPTYTIGQIKAALEKREADCGD